MNDEAFQLSDGRKLGFRCLGEPTGRALFFFHGTPGSRIALTEIDAIARIPGVRFIMPERPGYGISDPQPGRTIVGWANDVAELADFLGLESFAVSGISGGGPHALACAARLPNRVTQALLFSSPAPVGFKGSTRGMSMGNKLGVMISRFAPSLVKLAIRGNAVAFRQDPQRCMAKMAYQFCRSDQVILKDKEYRDAVMNDTLEGYRQNGDAHAIDALLVMSGLDWGFRLEEITIPVYLWHGLDDTLVTLPMANYLENHLPNCRAWYIPGAGHLLTEHPRVVEQVRNVMLRDS